MTKAMPSFQQYQRAFTAHLRDPQQHPKPKNVATKGMAVYQEIVFNNLFESVSACFPVAQKVMGKRAWRKLIRAFFSEHASSTPIFRKIPEEFLRYLTHVNATAPECLPAYLSSLCHYEWVELFVSTMADVSDKNIINPIGDLRKHRPAFAPMQLLNYEYAVQTISPRNKPNEKINTQLLVYRNATFSVKFIAINALTFRLLTLLTQEKMTSEQALTLLAHEMQQAQTESIIAFGLDVLEDLRSQGVILGVYQNQ